MSKAASRRATYLIVVFGLLGGIVVALASGPPPRPGSTGTEPVVRRPAGPSSLAGAPPEVQEYLGRALEKPPDNGSGVTRYQFSDWEREGRPTREAIGLKAIPGVDPETLIGRVMDVDGYKGNIAHLEVSRSQRDPAYKPPEKVRFLQLIRVGIAHTQQVLVLVDAGTIKGYRVAYWYLLRGETMALHPRPGVRSDFNIGAWLAAPGVVGFALSSWPLRGDVNRIQWASLTSGANALAKTVVEGNIDGMAAWAKKRGEDGPTTK